MMATPCFQHDSYRRDCGDCRDMNGDDERPRIETMTQQTDTLEALAAELEGAGEGQQADRIWKSGAAIFGEDFEGERAQRFVWFAQKEAWTDAALTLVPEGLKWGIGNPQDGYSYATMGGLERAVRAATPALALCAASLKARAKVKE